MTHVSQLNPQALEAVIENIDAVPLSRMPALLEKCDALQLCARASEHRRGLSWPSSPPQQRNTILIIVYYNN